MSSAGFELELELKLELELDIYILPQFTFQNILVNQHFLFI